MSDTADQLRIERRNERRTVAPYRGGIAVRLIVTWMFFIAAWVALVIATTAGPFPLWLGALGSFVISTTFYMPLHEATHGNVWGDVSTARWGEEVVGMTSSFWVGFSYRGHRISHMKHHAFTNDPAKDPDFFVHGSKLELLPKLYAGTLVNTFLPLFAFVPPARMLLPSVMKQEGARLERSPAENRYTFRFWLLRTLALIAAFSMGVGWEALWLWFVPSAFVIWWLAFIFAWYPHHPADGQVGRYVDTRVATFPGSTIIIRGHDHHALHHLFPRVVHYKLPKLWKEIGPELTAKGVRTEGTALGATGPIVW